MNIYKEQKLDTLNDLHTQIKTTLKTVDWMRSILLRDLHDERVQNRLLSSLEDLQHHIDRFASVCKE